MLASHLAKAEHHWDDVRAPARGRGARTPHFLDAETEGEAFAQMEGARERCRLSISVCGPRIF